MDWVPFMASRMQSVFKLMKGNYLLAGIFAVALAAGGCNMEPASVKKPDFFRPAHGW